LRDRAWFAPLPPTQGGRRPAIPDLWERARAFFGRMGRQVTDTFGTMRILSMRAILRRKEKRELMHLLLPAQKLARLCIVIEAATWLVMTPEGRKLLRETPKQSPPEQTRIPFQPTNTHVVSVPYPGWNTIARHRRPEPPLPAPNPEPEKDRFDPA